VSRIRQASDRGGAHHSRFIEFKCRAGRKLYLSSEIVIEPVDLIADVGETVAQYGFRIIVGLRIDCVRRINREKSEADGSGSIDDEKNFVCR
jgi:hypothetical protein